MRLRHRYNVVALLIGSGELVASFEDCCAAVVGPICYADPHPVESEYIVRRLLATYPIAYAIANSAESRRFVPALAAAFVPVVSLIHEFASYTRPKNQWPKVWTGRRRLFFQPRRRSTRPGPSILISPSDRSMFCLKAGAKYLVHPGKRLSSLNKHSTKSSVPADGKMLWSCWASDTFIFEKVSNCLWPARRRFLQ